MTSHEYGCCYLMHHPAGVSRTETGEPLRSGFDRDLQYIEVSSPHRKKLDVDISECALGYLLTAPPLVL